MPSCSPARSLPPGVLCPRGSAGGHSCLRVRRGADCRRDPAAGGFRRRDPQLVARAGGEMAMTTETADPLLHVTAVSHSVGGLQVLRGVDFGVPAGSLTGLIGPNGAGKSTLFNIISGFLTPQHGSVQFDGRDITRDPVQTRG